MIKKGKLIKLLKVYGFPLYFLFYVVGLTIAVLVFYFSALGNLEATISFGVQAILTLFTVFAGIFAPLMIQRRQKAQDDRKEMGFYLSLIWGELRTNEHRLEQIKLNLTFKTIMEIPGFTNMIGKVKMKYETIDNQIQELPNSFFLAAQESGAVSTIDEDNVLNTILQAYENVGILKFESMTTKQDFILKCDLAVQNFDPLSVPEIDLLKDDIRKKLIGINQSVIFASQQVETALHVVDDKLNKIGVKAELEERKVPILNDIS